jgi:predicted small secreted protein
MTAKERITCRRKFFFFAFYLEGFMKRITITSIVALLALWLAACNSSGTGSGQNATQVATQPSPGAQEVKPQVTNTQGAKQTSTGGKSSGVRGDKQSVKYAKHRGNGAKRSIAKTQRRVSQQGEYIELQVVETQGVDQVVIDVIQPTEEIKAQSMEVIERPVQPAVIVDTYDTVVIPQARRIYRASSAYPECSTAYENWVEVRVQ